MTRLVHRLVLTVYTAIVLVSLILLIYTGYAFYSVPIVDRFFHPDYELLKPSGFLGHGYGIIGTLLILVGIFSYMARKRFHILSRVGVLKYWLDFHIFMCVQGSVLILFHTSFKFGGIVSVAFWSMVVVLASGVLGRYIYLQIPRSIEGRELSLHEVELMRAESDNELYEKYGITAGEIASEKRSAIKNELKRRGVKPQDYRKVLHLIRSERMIAMKIRHLDKMKNLFRYWHVAHLPFALIMLIIMIIHVIVALTFGYKWIF